MIITILIPVDPHDRFNKEAIGGLVDDAITLGLPGQEWADDFTIVGARQKDMAHLALDVDVNDTFDGLI